MACVENGYFQREVSDAAYKDQVAVDHGERVTVGVNAYQVQEELQIPVFRPDPASEHRQKPRIGEVCGTLRKVWGRHTDPAVF